MQECLAGGCGHLLSEPRGGGWVVTRETTAPDKNSAGIVGVQRQATLLSGLMLLLTHLHGGELTSMPVLPVVAAAPTTPWMQSGRSLRIVEAVLVPGSAEGHPQCFFPEDPRRFPVPVPSPVPCRPLSHLPFPNLVALARLYPSPRIPLLTSC